MKLKDQLKTGWTFIVTVILFVLLAYFSTSGLYNVSNMLWGSAYLLLAVTLTFTCVNASKKFKEQGRFGTYGRLLYAAGLLSGLWLYEAIKCFF
ncbi:MAG: hypothetical protein WCZ43_07290 [Proteiniphilum sp.]